MPAPAKRPRRLPEDEEDRRFPNLAAQRDWDRAQHVKKAEEAGLSREEAVRHADREVRED
ncbi:MAG TPA: hypothetical protein VHI93_03575 [Candidatus Thermoplasmatota archaeon]|nr:hypothetical protein [Candidatus Thermoplasmatota archaeon]